MTWPNVFQGGVPGPVVELYRVMAFPTIFVLDEEGIIRHVDLRGAQLERTVDEMVADLVERRQAK